MRAPSPKLAGRFRDIVARVGAAFREQRRIEACRAVRRYRHLLEQPLETLPLNEIVPVSSEEEMSGHAHQLDTRERSLARRAFEGA